MCIIIIFSAIKQKLTRYYHQYHRILWPSLAQIMCCVGRRKKKESRVLFWPWATSRWGPDSGNLRTVNVILADRQTNRQSRPRPCVLGDRCAVSAQSAMCYDGMSVVMGDSARAPPTPRLRSPPLVTWGPCQGSAECLGNNHPAGHVF